MDRLVLALFVLGLQLQQELDYPTVDLVLMIKTVTLEIINVNIVQPQVQIEYHVLPNLKELELHLLHAHADKDITITHLHHVMHVIPSVELVLGQEVQIALHVLMLPIYLVLQLVFQVDQQITLQVPIIENVGLTQLNC
jgi:hypothetical protein